MSPLGRAIISVCVLGIPSAYTEGSLNKLCCKLLLNTALNASLDHLLVK